MIDGIFPGCEGGQLGHPCIVVRPVSFLFSAQAMGIRLIELSGIFVEVGQSLVGLGYAVRFPGTIRFFLHPFGLRQKPGGSLFGLIQIHIVEQEEKLVGASRIVLLLE